MSSQWKSLSLASSLGSIFISERPGLSPGSARCEWISQLRLWIPRRVHNSLHHSEVYSLPESVITSHGTSQPPIHVCAHHLAPDLPVIDSMLQGNT